MNRCYCIRKGGVHRETEIGSRKLETTPALPTAVSGPVHGWIVRGGVDIGDPRIRLVHRQHDILLNYFPVRFVSHGIVWNLVDVVGRSKIVERLRSFLLVKRVFPDGIPQ